MSKVDPLLEETPPLRAHVLSRMSRPAGQASVSLLETETQRSRRLLTEGRWRRQEEIVATEKQIYTPAKLGWS